MMFAAAWVGMAVSMAVQAANTRAAEGRNAVLIDFSSPHCPPCRAMQPVLAQLEAAGIPIRHVNVASEPQLASRYGVAQTPTFIVVTDGREVTRLVGMQSAAQLRAALATDPTGPLVATRTTAPAPPHLQAPQTRLAPIGQSAPSIGESMPSLSVADAVQRAQAATVRLRVHDGHGFGAGTGTIIDTHGDEALVLTCGHLFRETKGQGKIEVDLFIGGETRTVPGQVLDYDADARDIALVVIQPGVTIQPVRVISADQRVANGTAAFSFGCDRGADPSRRDTRITGVDKYNQHLGVSNLEIQGAPIDGRSGGGLFDQQGRLIGVCNAADYQNDVGIYAGPGTVHWQLDRAQLTGLYRDPDGPTPTHPEPLNSEPLNPEPLNPEPIGADRMAALPVPAASAVVPTAAPVGGEQEVIVIVRQRGNPDSSRVMTLREPTDDLLHMIERQSR